MTLTNSTFLWKGFQCKQEEHQHPFCGPDTGGEQVGRKLRRWHRCPFRLDIDGLSLVDEKKPPGKPGKIHLFFTKTTKKDTYGWLEYLGSAPELSLPARHSHPITDT